MTPSPRPPFPAKLKAEAKNRSDFTRELTYLKSLAKLHRRFMVPPGGNDLVPPELITQILAQIESVKCYSKPTLLDPKLNTIHRLMDVSTLLGCAHDTVAARDECVFQGLHKLILKRIVGLKDLKFEIDSESNDDDYEEEDYEDDDGDRPRWRRGARAENPDTE
ncbi:MAG: hypothetical protein Q9169_008096 [Polycauliona sp. 2 TL-2023]